MGNRREVPAVPRRDKAESHPIAFLRWFSNTDKHRGLHPSFGALEAGHTHLSLATRDVEGPDDTKVLIHADRPFKDQTPLLRLHFDITGPNPDVHVEGKFPSYIAFGDFPKAIKLTTLPWLCEIVELLDQLAQPLVDG